MARSSLVNKGKEMASGICPFSNSLGDLTSNTTPPVEADKNGAGASDCAKDTEGKEAASEGIEPPP